MTGAKNGLISWELSGAASALPAVRKGRFRSISKAGAKNTATVTVNGKRLKSTPPRSHICLMPKMDETKLLVEQAVAQIRASSKALAAMDEQMRELAQKLPEYSIVMEMYGVGPRLGPQLMAE